MTKHFFEALECEINFQVEYEKLEQLIVKEQIWGPISSTEYGNACMDESINSFIERNFRSWPNRKRFISFKELREHLGFGFTIKNGSYSFAKGIDISQYFLYCEMILSMLKAFPPDAKFANQAQVVTDTIKATVEDSGFQIQELQETVIIVEKNAAAFEVAESIPEIADIIIEYNHFLLQGDLQRKREILKQIGDAFEPYREELESINKPITSDFFMMLNKMNIRHNNIDPSDRSNYVHAFAIAPKDEQEKWYDIIYKQALLLSMLREQPARTKLITDFKNSLHYCG